MSSPLAKRIFAAQLSVVQGGIGDRDGGDEAGVFRLAVSPPKRHYRLRPRECNIVADKTPDETEPPMKSLWKTLFLCVISLALAGIVLPAQALADDGPTESVTITPARVLRVGISGRAWNDSDAFAFKVTGLNGAPEPADTTITVTKEDTLSFLPDHAEIKVGAITFTEPGTYRYEVTQVQGSDPDIVYDTHVGAFEFVVGRVQGELVAVGNGFWSPTFTNSYEPALNFTEAGGITLSAVMNGRDSVYPEYMVTVVPEDQASKALLLGRQVGQYVGVFRFPSAKDGQPATVDFFEVRDGKPIVFTKEDVGKTYRYSLVSAKGLSYPATAYDMAERTLAIEVGRRDDGRVTATTTVTTAGADSETYVYTAGEKPARAAVVSFVNTFAPRGQVRLGARVTLTGRELAGGEFSVELLDEQGNVLQTAANAADGSVTFAPITYTRMGTYRYSIREVAGDEEGIAYDARVYQVTVVAEQIDPDGSLIPEVSYGDGVNEAVFNNAYVAPEKPSSSPSPRSLGGSQLRVAEEAPAQTALKDEPRSPIPATGDPWATPHFLGIAAAGAALLVLRARLRNQ